MKIKTVLNIAGCVITVLFGMLGCFFPELASDLTGLTASTPSSIAEFRGTFGAAFIAVGLFSMLARRSVVYLTAGLLWWGAAGGRALSMILDHGLDDVKNFSGLSLELLVGFLLIAGNWSFNSLKEKK